VKNDYYIKYYLKSIENPLFKDVTAWHIWQFCLLEAFPDGSFTTGRFQMEEFTGVKGITAYKALKRLEKSKMVTIKVTGGINNRFSEISIVNWEKYQPLLTTSNDNPSNNQVTIKEQSSNNQVTHLDKEERIKNKEIKKEESTRQWLVSLPPKDKIYFSEKYKNIEIEEEVEKAVNWLNMTGKRYKNYKAFLENWCKKAESWAKEKSKIDNSDIKIPDYLKDFERTKNEPNVGKKIS
jgi:hypothetical protein